MLLFVFLAPTSRVTLLVFVTGTSSPPSGNERDIYLFSDYTLIIHWLLVSLVRGDTGAACVCYEEDTYQIVQYVPYLRLEFEKDLFVPTTRSLSRGL